MSLTIELVEGSEYRVEQSMDSLPPITVGLYRAFLAKGKLGLEALGVYMHLLFTYRLQHTNIVRAEDAYLKDGLQIGDKKLKNAKSLLFKMGLIRYVRKRGAGGRTERWYLELVLQPNPGPRTKQAPTEQESQADPWFAERDAEEDTEEEAVDFEEKKSPQKKLFTLYYTLHKQRCGTFPRFTRADAVVLDADLKLHGLEKMAGYITWLFEHPPARMTFGIRGMGIHTFLPEAIKALSETDRKLRLLKTCSSCGASRDTSGLDCPACGEPDAYRKEADRAAQ